MQIYVFIIKIKNLFIKIFITTFVLLYYTLKKTNEMEQEKTYQLVDAQEMHLRNPLTFGAPSKEAVLGLTEGMLVTLKVKHERFKIRLTFVSEELMVGKIQTVMLPGTGLAEGQTIEFNWRNVLATSSEVVPDKFATEKGKLAFRFADEEIDDVGKNLGLAQERADFLGTFALCTVQDEIDRVLNSSLSKTEGGVKVASINVGKMIALSTYPCNTPQEVAFIAFLVPQMANDLFEDQAEIYGFREAHRVPRNLGELVESLFSEDRRSPLDELFDNMRRANRGRSDIN